MQLSSSVSSETRRVLLLVRVFGRFAVCASIDDPVDDAVSKSVGMVRFDVDGAGECCGHGLCLSDGTCECADGYGPLNPWDRAAPNDCCGRVCAADCGAAEKRGYCDTRTGKCSCLPGWAGAACARALCPKLKYRASVG